MSENLKLGYIKQQLHCFFYEPTRHTKLTQVYSRLALKGLNKLMDKQHKYKLKPVLLGHLHLGHLATT
jgi:hypothetical protein